MWQQLSGRGTTTDRKLPIKEFKIPSFDSSLSKALTVWHHEMSYYSLWAKVMMHVLKMCCQDFQCPLGDGLLTVVPRTSVSKLYNLFIFYHPLQLPVIYLSCPKGIHYQSQLQETWNFILACCFQQIGKLIDLSVRHLISGHPKRQCCTCAVIHILSSKWQACMKAP